MRSPSIRRLGLWLVAVAAGLVLLWIVLGFILGTSRGLDMTDEGLYLLAADPPNASASWVGTALEDQLGLKLTAAERPVEFLIVDQVQRPTSD